VGQNQGIVEGGGKNLQKPERAGDKLPKLLIFIEMRKAGKLS
jgi:hypothetical protein